MSDQVSGESVPSAPCGHQFQPSADTQFVRGEIIGADFSERDDGRIVVLVAVDGWTSVGRHRVVMQDEGEFDRRLPSWDDVQGLLS